MKKVLSLFLVVLLCVASVPFAFAASTGITSFQVNPYGGAQDAIDTVNWHASGGMYFLFLPADADPEQATVFFTASDSVTCDGTPLVSGAQTAAFAASGDHTLQCAGNTYTLRVIQSGNLPAVYLKTESGSLNYIHANKENKEKADIRIYENGEMTLDGELKQIKGRGNSTWGFEKKPYNIKFDKKTSLFGMPKAKKWSLLASVLDPSLIRNYLALSFAQQLDLPYTSEMRYADLYINGEYRGNYIFIESVEIGDNRVEINDLEDANEDANPDLDIETLPHGSGGGRKWVEMPNNPADVTGGYLLEFDYRGRYAAEVSGFESNRGYTITVKSPEYASKAEVNYIADYFQAFEDAMFSSNGYNAQGKHYTDYIDLDSFAKNYVVQEIMFNLDAGQSSFFMYKDAGTGKLVASPVWDFDYTLGTFSPGQDVGMDATNPTLLYVNKLGTVIAQLFKRYEAFRTAANTQWAALTGFLPSAVADARQLAAKLNDSAVMDGVRWRVFGGATDANAVSAAYAASVDAALSYLTRRGEALSRSFTPQAAFLYYSANGGGGRRLEENVHVIGERVTVKNSGDQWTRISAPNDNVVFSHWNTKADGSGTSYAAGDQITLTQSITTLYAQWRQKTSGEQFQERSQSFWARIRDFFLRIWNFFTRMFR